YLTSADGKAVHKGLNPMAKGSRLPGKEGVRVGVIPIAFTFLSMGTGEPDTSKVVCPVRGGTGRKGSNDLARGLPYLLRRSRFRRRLTPSVRLRERWVTSPRQGKSPTRAPQYKVKRSKFFVWLAAVKKGQRGVVGAET